MSLTVNACSAPRSQDCTVAYRRKHARPTTSHTSFHLDKAVSVLALSCLAPRSQDCAVAYKRKHATAPPSHSSFDAAVSALSLSRFAEKVSSPAEKGLFYRNWRVSPHSLPTDGSERVLLAKLFPPLAVRYAETEQEIFSFPLSGTLPDGRVWKVPLDVYISALGNFAEEVDWDKEEMLDEAEELIENLAVIRPAPLTLVPYHYFLPCTVEQFIRGGLRVRSRCGRLWVVLPEKKSLWQRLDLAGLFPQLTIPEKTTGRKIFAFDTSGVDRQGRTLVVNKLLVLGPLGRVASPFTRFTDIPPDALDVITNLIECFMEPCGKKGRMVTWAPLPS